MPGAYGGKVRCKECLTTTGSHKKSCSKSPGSRQPKMPVSEAPNKTNSGRSKAAQRWLDLLYADEVA